jgi:hypothetical protein
MADFLRDFWMRETGTGQQVAQFHDRYIMMMMMMVKWLILNTNSSEPIYNISCLATVESGVEP